MSRAQDPHGALIKLDCQILEGPDIGLLFDTLPLLPMKNLRVIN